jgi:hypothetical protein
VLEHTTQAAFVVSRHVAIDLQRTAVQVVNYVIALQPLCRRLDALHKTIPDTTDFCMLLRL